MAKTQSSGGGRGCGGGSGQRHRRSFNISPGIPAGEKQILLGSPADPPGQQLSEAGEDESLMHQGRQQRTGWGDLQYL